MTDCVESFAAQRGLPTLTVIPFELLRVAAGNPMVVRDQDGREILLRLPTTAELLEQVRQAGERLEAMGAPPGPGMTEAKAEELSRPVDIERVANALRDAQPEVERLNATLAAAHRENAQLHELAERLGQDLDRRNSAIQRATLALQDMP